MVVWSVWSAVKLFFECVVLTGEREREREGGREGQNKKCKRCDGEVELIAGWDVLGCHHARYKLARA